MTKAETWQRRFRSRRVSPKGLMKPMCLLWLKKRSSPVSGAFGSLFGGGGASARTRSVASFGATPRDTKSLAVMMRARTMSTPPLRRALACFLRSRWPRSSARSSRVFFVGGGNVSLDDDGVE